MFVPQVYMHGMHVVNMARGISMSASGDKAYVSVPPAYSLTPLRS